MTENPLVPIRVAFIIDNVVQDVISTDERLAAIFLSNPVVIDITDKPNTFRISVNSSYDPETGEFTDAPPSQSIGIERPDEPVIDDSPDLPLN